MQNTSEKQELNEKQHLSGYELTYCTIHKLKNYDLTATAKLVLILLTTHYNEQKNGAVVFPSIPFISDTLGIGQTAVKQAIKDLILKGLIIKSKRGKIKGNYNKYLLTLKVQNTAFKQAENELSKQAESDLFHEHEPVNMNLSKETTNKGKKVVVLKNFNKGAEEETQKELSSTTSFVSSKVHYDLKVIPDILKAKAESGEIRNLQGYWASLRPQVKQEYWEKDTAQKLKIQKQAELKEQQRQERIRKQQEQKELKEELEKPLNEQFTREQAISFCSRLYGMKKTLASQGIAGNLIKIYNIQEGELLHASKN